MSKLGDLLKQKSGGPRTKGQSVIAKLQNQVPYGRTGDTEGSGGIVPIQKAMALAGGFLEAGHDGETREAVDLSNRIKSVYGAFYDFSNNPKSILVPASAGYLPTVAANGADIHGARELRKEIGQRILTVKGIDPDEITAKAAGGSELATKALSTLSDLAGGATVAPPSLGDLIDLQRNMEVMTRCGATNVTLPPNGRMAFPKLTGGSTAYWVGETANTTESQQTTGSLLLEAKKLGVRTPFTNELMRFSDSSIDGMVRVDQARQGALKADLAQLEGTGGTQPKGLITYQTQTSWTQGTDKMLSYSVTNSTFQPGDVAGMIAALPDEVEPNAWVMRRAMWAKIRNRRADGVVPGDGQGPFVFNITRTVEDGGRSQTEQLDGTKVVWSSQVSAARGSGAQTYVLVGYFPDWVVGRLGILEFMVDPYTLMQSYQTVIQCIQFIDAGARHAASFCFADSVTIQ